MEDVKGDGAGQLGECHAGPWDGKHVASRFPAGFILVDKPRSLVWIYDWRGTGYVCRNEIGDELDFEKRVATAEGQEFDVLCWEAMGE